MLVGRHVYSSSLHGLKGELADNHGPGAAFAAHGNNGWGWPDFTNEDTLLYITIQGMATLGLSPAPIYSAHGAWMNLFSDGTSGANFACNAR